ncbi:MAG: SufD family Fe-S cluster assembly protein [Elusimicrobia bacterium]|nr:SufD family Fe-S cluster assembly protein [Elusimicrobiota bacterium]
MIATSEAVVTTFDAALREHPALVDAALKTVGREPFGFFLRVSRGVQLERPVSPPERPRGSPPPAEERTLIVAEEGAGLQYVEGCISSAAPLSTATVVLAMPGARVRCTTLRNLPSGAVSIKRAVAEQGARVEWLDGSFGAPTPAVVLEGEGSVLSAAFHGRVGELTRGERRSTVSLDEPGAEALYYLMTRGLDRAAAAALLVNGFFEPFTRELPLEYAVEFNRFVELELKGA